MTRTGVGIPATWYATLRDFSAVPGLYSASGLPPAVVVVVRWNETPTLAEAGPVACEQCHRDVRTEWAVTSAP